MRAMMAALTSMGARTAVVICAALLAMLPPLSLGPAQAQSPTPWTTTPHTFRIPIEPQSPPTANPTANNSDGEITLIALLSDEGQRINRGLVWRVFKLVDGSNQLVVSSRLANPTFKLPSGGYAVNVSYGRAYLTRTVTVKPGLKTDEQFVINAGGLRVFARLSNGDAPPAGSVSYDIYSDEREQDGSRRTILTGIRPGVVIRLNSGIYQLKSRLGDANATISAEVTVEAGKLTEATFVHDAGKVTFKLVRQAGGEAISDVNWVILGANGEVVKETAGALPSHMLAPGTYTVSARWLGKLYTRQFSLKTGDNVEVEVELR